MKKILSFILILALTAGLGGTVCAYGAEQFYSYSNETVLEICYKYSANLITLAESIEDDTLDLVNSTGTVVYRESELGYGDSGVAVASGATLSDNDTVMMGAGTSIDGSDEHWYVSFVFNSEASMGTQFVTTLALVRACVQMGFDMFDAEPDENELAAAVIDVSSFLLASERVALESNGMVLLHKELGDGSHVLALDSLAYYDDFYYNDIENYIVLD